MLPKQHRLFLRKELHRIQKEGKVCQFPLFGLLVAQGDASVSRFAFIVSKKIHKRAVKRNRIKRLLRESVRSFLPKINPGYEVVFLVKKRVLEKDFQAVKSAVKKSFERIGLL